MAVTQAVVEARERYGEQLSMISNAADRGVVLLHVDTRRRQRYR